MQAILDMAREAIKVKNVGLEVGYQSWLVYPASFATRPMASFWHSLIGLIIKLWLKAQNILFQQHFFSLALFLPFLANYYDMFEVALTFQSTTQ